MVVERSKASISRRLRHAQGQRVQIPASPFNFSQLAKSGQEQINIIHSIFGAGGQRFESGAGFQKFFSHTSFSQCLSLYTIPANMGER